MQLKEQKGNTRTSDDAPQPYTGVDAPLNMRFETRALWPRLKVDLGIDEAGAAIALDLYAEALTTGRHTSYSRRKEHYATHQASRPRWSARDSLYTYAKVVPAIDRMATSELVENLVAPRGQTGWQSRMRATPRLVDAVRGIVRGGPPLAVHRPSAGLVLRNAEGDPVSFRENATTRRIERRVEVINEGLRSMRIEGAFPACAVRICNTSLERGGRFYLEGGSIQVMPKSQRLRVTWSGERSGEVDYKTMHISMLYSDADETPPEDAYDVPGFPRPLVKVAMLTIVNASTYRSALGSIATDEKMVGVAEPGSPEAYAKAARLITALKRLHRPISPAFHSGAGAFLMRRESDVMEDVMLTMGRLGEVVVPIHDSALCRAGAVATLEQVMIEAAERAGLKRTKIDTTMAANDHAWGPESRRFRPSEFEG